MNSYAMILTASDEKEAFNKASKAAERYGIFSVSSVINFDEETELFKNTSVKMIEMYISLINANKNLIEKFKDKVPDDDFILNQMKENLIRFEKGFYKFPDEWRIVFFDGIDFEHIDSLDFFDKLIKQYKPKDLYMALIDTP